MLQFYIPSWFSFYFRGHLHAVYHLLIAFSNPSSSAKQLFGTKHFVYLCFVVCFF